MPEFKVCDVFGVTTGILAGEVAGIYEVLNYLTDRSLYTHELAFYADQASAAIIICHPEMPDDATPDNWREVLSDCVQARGETMELDPALKGVLADDKDFREILHEMGFAGKLIEFKG